jgi:hypothetical protein
MDTSDNIITEELKRIVQLQAKENKLIQSKNINFRHFRH